MSHDDVEAISKIEKVGKSVQGVNSVEVESLGQMDPNAKEGANSEHFARLLAEKTNEAQQAKTQELAIQRPTPIEASQNTQRRVIHHKDDMWQGLITESEANINKISSLKQQLETNNIELSRPVRSSMQRSLVHVDESLKIALSKVGVDYTPPVAQASGLVAPVQKFLGYLSNGQNQLEALSNQLTTLNATDQHITPSNMLALQLKMGVITQQIEFFSSLLNKCLESTKTIMNVQV